VRTTASELHLRPSCSARCLASGPALSGPFEWVECGENLEMDAAVALVLVGVGPGPPFGSQAQHGQASRRAIVRLHKILAGTGWLLPRIPCVMQSNRKVNSDNPKHAFGARQPGPLGSRSAARADTIGR